MKILYVLIITALALICLGSIGISSAAVVTTINSADNIPALQTTTIPVTMTGADGIIFFEARIQTNSSIARIAVNNTQPLSGTYLIKDNFVSWLREGTYTINGTATLFYLDVTPASNAAGSSIPLEFTFFDTSDITYKTEFVAVPGKVTVLKNSGSSPDPQPAATSATSSSGGTSGSSSGQKYTPPAAGTTVTTPVVTSAVIPSVTSSGSDIPDPTQTVSSAGTVIQPVTPASGPAATKTPAPLPGILSGLGIVLIISRKML